MFANALVFTLVAQQPPPWVSGHVACEMPGPEKPGFMMKNLALSLANGVRALFLMPFGNYVEYWKFVLPIRHQGPCQPAQEERSSSHG